MSNYENTGTLTLNGTTYTIDTYYPMGKRRPEYKIFCVWSREGDKHIFAGEMGFIKWLEKSQAPVQRELW